MIRWVDTVRTEYPAGYWRPSTVTGSVSAVQHALPGEWHWHIRGIAHVELYVELRYYHVVRSMIYNLTSAFVRVDVIPLAI